MLGLPSPEEISTHGFTLVEVLLAIFFLSVALLGTAALLDSVIAKNLLANQITTATTLAQEKIEELKNKQYAHVSGITADSDTYPSTHPIFTREWGCDVTDPNEPGIGTVTVRVSWQWKGKPYSVVLKTYVSE